MYICAFLFILYLRSIRIYFSHSIKGDEAQFVYNGDRQTEEIVHFALRVANPPVRQFKDGDLINRLRKEDIIFFSYLGEATGELWVSVHNTYFSFFLRLSLTFDKFLIAGRVSRSCH